MKKFLYTILLGSFLASGSSFAEEETPLVQKMDQVARSLKLLRRAKDDYAKCIELVREAQQGILDSFQYMPVLFEKLPEGKEKMEAEVAYKKSMADSYKALCDLELAYLSEDEDKIDDAMDVVKKSRKDGHEEFIEEE